LKPAATVRYNRAMLERFAKAALVALALAIAATSADALAGRQKREQRRPPEPAAPTIPIDKRDSLVAAPGAFNGHPYWLALAQCGGIYFKLNVLYTDIAVRARVVKPDARANAEYTKKLTEAIKTATTFFDGAEHFLMTDRGIERSDAVLTYDGQSRAAGDKLKTIDTALAAAKACPALYQACREAFSKQCNEPLAPAS
jgi:hypothetical protein